MRGSGYRHYHPDVRSKFSESAPRWPIRNSVCALVVSVETRKGPTPCHFAECLSTERTMGGWLAGGPGFEPRLTGSEPVVLPLNYPPKGRRKGRRRLDLA